jgi:phage shock protein A
MILTREAIAEQLVALPDLIAEAETRFAQAVQAGEEFEAALILSGAINGGNAEVRKAQLVTHTQEFEQETARQRVELHRLQNRLAALRSVARVIGGGE